jgi:hypothetical protein
MKRCGIIVAALMVIAAAGCSNTVTKQFKVIADPPDAAIRVFSGIELKELKFRSPATITAETPNDPALAARAVVEVRKENYKTRTIALRDINNGDTLNIRLEKTAQNLVRYRLAYQLISPEVSPELKFRDNAISVSFIVGEQSFQMRFDNVGHHDLKILWERAEYTDVYSQTQRLMHSGIRFQDRNNPLPDQLVTQNSSIQEAVIPVGNVFVPQQKKTYDIRPLFPLDSEAAAGLKNRSVILFIPVEIDRQIIPYIFKIQIIDAVKEAAKG